MWKLLRTALAMLVLMTVLCGGIYPLAVTAFAQLCFPEQANGSLVVEEGRVVGSRLLGQPFEEARYFWSRPSATTPFPYNAAASGGSNLGPSNPALREAVAARARALHASDPGNPAPIPVDLVTASASGLDPHISAAAALWQVARVAQARLLPRDDVRRTVEEYTEGRQLGLFGEPRVNVAELNRALDRTR
jgi:potassium-transporting ATPase KdpC subunit